MRSSQLSFVFRSLSPWPAAKAGKKRKTDTDGYGGVGGLAGFLLRAFLFMVVYFLPKLDK